MHVLHGLSSSRSDSITIAAGGLFSTVTALIGPGQSGFARRGNLRQEAAVFGGCFITRGLSPAPCRMLPPLPRAVYLRILDTRIRALSGETAHAFAAPSSKSQNLSSCLPSVAAATARSDLPFQLVVRQRPRLILLIFLHDHGDVVDDRHLVGEVGEGVDHRRARPKDKEPQAGSPARARPRRRH